MRYIICLLFLAACLPAQQPLAFEVASIKQRPRNATIVMIGGHPSGSRLTLEAMSLSDLISWAYDVKPWQVTGGPAWGSMPKDRTVLDSNTRRFDITAKAEGDAPRPIQDFRRMLQSLLTERFHLALHRESKDTAVYALVPDKNGPKFHESAPDANGVLRMNGRGKLTATGGTMTQLVNWFSNANGVDRPIIDRSGLTGHYDFTLEWSNPLAGGDTTAPSIFTALPEQLGLRLEPRRAPVEMLVIDQAELPAEN